MSEMEQLIQSAASAHGFSACVMSCNPADMLETVRSVPASAVGMIIETRAQAGAGFRPRDVKPAAAAQSGAGFTYRESRHHPIRRVARDLRPIKNLTSKARQQKAGKSASPAANPAGPQPLQ